MKLSDMKTANEALAERLKEPAFREAWEGTGLARSVALRVVGYRVEHGLTQTELGRLLGMSQPAVARLEAGEHEPSLATLARLSRSLGIEFHIDITPDMVELTA